MKNLPCIDCLTLPICRSLYVKLLYEFASEYIPRKNLEEKCCLLKSYLEQTGCEESNKKDFHILMQK